MKGEPLLRRFRQPTNEKATWLSLAAITVAGQRRNLTGLRYSAASQVARPGCATATVAVPEQIGTLAGWRGTVLPKES